MATEPHDERSRESQEFLAESEQPRASFLKEFLGFLLHSPSWWLAPIVIVLVLLGLAVAFIPAEALPFIYTLW